MKPQVLFIIFLIVLTSLCDTITQILLKSSINRIGVSFPGKLREILRFIFRLILIPRLWIGFLFSVLSLCIWLFVLSRADLNFAFSVDSMHYIFIALASWIFLKERVGARRWLGTALIVAGIVLVSLS